MGGWGWRERVRRLQMRWARIGRAQMGEHGSRCRECGRALLQRAWVGWVDGVEWPGGEGAGVYGADRARKEQRVWVGWRMWMSRSCSVGGGEVSGSNAGVWHLRTGRARMGWECGGHEWDGG